MSPPRTGSGAILALLTDVELLSAAFMKNGLFLIVVLSALVATGITACSQKPNAKNELEKAAVTLEKADATVAAPAPAAPSPTPAPATPSPEVVQPKTTPSQQMT